MGNSRRFVAFRSHALALTVALSPAFLQTTTCVRGDTYLLSLELEVNGQNLVQDFDINNRSYAVSASGATATLTVETREADSTATYQWIVDGTSIEAGVIGVGGGSVVLNVPAGESQLYIGVRAFEGTVDGYTVNINRTGVTDVVTLACTDTVFLTDDITFLDVELTVTPSGITPGALFSADLSAVMPFPESILDLAQILSGGVKRATFEDLQVTVHVRSGAFGHDVVLVPKPPLPGSETCALHEAAPGEPASCDPANDNPDGSNDDCLYFGAPNVNDPCAVFVDADIEEDCAICAAMDPAGATGDITKAAQCTRNGFCIAGPFFLPLESQTGLYVADTQGDVLFGLADDGTEAILNPDDSWTLAPASINPTSPDYPYVNGLRAGVADDVWGFIRVGMECTMAIDTGTGPGTDPATQQASRTPDSDLIALDIVDPCEGIICPDDGNDCTSDACSQLDGSCPYAAEPYGTACDFGGSPGVCVDGVCVDPCDVLTCDDGRECTQDSCVDGACVYDPYLIGTPCSQNGGSVCLLEECVECIDAADCGLPSYNECVDVYVCNANVCERPTLGDGFACTNQASGYSGYCDDFGACQDQPHVYMHACNSYSPGLISGWANWPVPARINGFAAPSVVSPGQTVTATADAEVTLPGGIGALAYNRGYFLAPGPNEIYYEATFTLNATNSVEGPQIAAAWSGTAITDVTDPDGLRNSGDEYATPVLLAPTIAQLQWTAAAEGQMVVTWEHLDIQLFNAITDVIPDYVMECAVGVPYYYSPYPGFFSLPSVPLDTVDVVPTATVTCPCWDGSPGSAGASVQDVWATLAPANCLNVDNCSDSDLGLPTDFSSFATCRDDVGTQLQTSAQSDFFSGGACFVWETFWSGSNQTGTGFQVTFSGLDEEQTAACRADHDAFTATTEFGGVQSDPMCGLPLPAP